MKKSILFFVSMLLSVSAFSVDSGLAENYVRNPVSSGFGLHRVLAGKPIKYVVREGRGAKPKKGKRDPNTKYVLPAGISAKGAVEEALALWFVFTKETIEKSGRSEEFADIMPYLSKPHMQEVTDEAQADITFFFGSLREVKDKCSGDVAGCWAGTEIVVPYMEYRQAGIAGEDDQDVTLVHEIGHFYGLGDEYWSANNKSLEYSTANRTGKNLTIMGHRDSLGCDDADGFINAIDFTLAYMNKGKWSERALSGWKSFCDNTRFAEGKQLERPDYVGDQCVYSFNQKRGNLSGKRCPEPFVQAGRTMQYTQKGVPLQLTDPDLNMLITYHPWFEVSGLSPTIQVKVKDLRTGKGIMELKAVRENGIWTMPYQEDNISVWLDNEGCHLMRLRNMGVLEDEQVGLSFNGKVVKAKYSVHLLAGRNYLGENTSLFTDLELNANIRASLNARSGWQCVIDLDDNERTLIYQEDELVSYDKNVVQQVASRYRVQPEELLEAGAQSCSYRRFVSSLKTRNLKDLCRMTSRLEDALRQYK